jgi:hypothetical protein
LRENRKKGQKREMRKTRIIIEMRDIFEKRQEKMM